MKTLNVKTRGQWRAWLKLNAGRETEVWLICSKKHASRQGLAYVDAVEEALCFGWIDGKMKSLDQDSFAQHFSPRNPKSRWAQSNIDRVRRLTREGKMTPAGLEAFRPDKPIVPLPSKLPVALAREFREHKTAWENFGRFPPSYQKMTIGWVASAKKQETQLRRLDLLISHSEANTRIKFM